jgi:hypothetical protein
MFPFNWTGEHTRRTREHVIEEMSLNFLERKVLERGHQLVPATRREYGHDATMFHFSPETGEIENGEVRFQLKATDHLDAEGEFAICPAIETRHLHYWYWEAQRLPFVLVLYDAARHRGYWVDIRRYIEDVLTGLDPEQKTTTIRIPRSSRISVRTIDQFREMSLARMHAEG